MKILPELCQRKRRSAKLLGQSSLIFSQQHGVRDRGVAAVQNADGAAATVAFCTGAPTGRTDFSCVESARPAL